MGNFAKLEWESRLPYVERWIPIGQHVATLAFRSGGGLAALLHDAPLRAYGIILERPPAVPPTVTGGPVIRASSGDKPPLGVPSDIVGVTPEGPPPGTSIRAPLG